MQITKEQLKSILPNCKNPQTVTNVINKYSAKYGIVNKQQMAMFLAQAGHESGSFNVLSENLNYSAEGLLKIFPKYFNNRLAAQYARNPQRIANHVYANRMGNGNEASGDGWRYRGGGFIQLTGKTNYSLFATSIGKSLNESCEYVRTFEGAMQSALYFWKRNNLNAVCNDITAATKRINGGTNGLSDRKSIWQRALKYL